jgi:hypothetical protein
VASAAYLAEHHILSLFEDLTSALIYHKPLGIICLFLYLPLTYQ